MEIPTLRRPKSRPKMDIKITIFWVILLGNKKVYKKNGKERYVFHTYDHNFGIVIPMETGVFWEQQTEGVLCNHIYVEGIYLPLEEPIYQNTNLLRELQWANYEGKTEKVQKIWKQIKKWMSEFKGIEWEEVEAPKDMPPNQEGLQWIKITRWHSPIPSWSYPKLIGKVVALYYPNSD